MPLRGAAIRISIQPPHPHVNKPMHYPTTVWTQLMAVRTDGKLQETHRSLGQLLLITVSKLGAIRGEEYEIRVYFAWNVRKILEHYAELVSALTQSPANYLVVEYIPSSTVSARAHSVSLAAVECQVVSYRSYIILFLTYKTSQRRREISSGAEQEYWYDSGKYMRLKLSRRCFFLLLPRSLPVKVFC